MNGVKLTSVQCVTVASTFKFSTQYNDAAGKAKRMLDFINRNFSFRDKYIILPLHINSVTPQLEYAVQY